MDSTTRAHLKSLWSTDRKLQNRAFFRMLDVTEKPVDWAYEVWDDVVSNLTHPDNHNRAIAAQILCALAKSDPKGRILRDFDALLNVTRDERFVTARHCLQALWKVGAAGSKQREQYMEGLRRRFQECGTEKNWSLIRSDIIQSLRNAYAAAPDGKLRELALQLIESEGDPKYRKKYAGFWKK